MADVFSKVTPTSPEEASRVTPRAEFRVFGQGIIETVKQNMWNGKTVLQQIRKMPTETYLLSVNSDEANVKVREGLLDIKVKIGETPEGYEIFQPRGKFQFPVKREDLAMVLEHLKVQIALPSDSYRLEEFISVVQGSRELAVVRVDKIRYGFTIEDVICEYAHVWFNGAMLESACCESENYAGMKKVIESLGIANLPNTNYIKAAKRVVGMQ